MHSNGRSLLVAAALTGAAQLGAQQLTHERAFGSVSSYLISIPIGDTRQFINDPSWLGLSWEGLWPYRGNMVVGAQLGVHDFYAENDGTVNFDWGAATGHQFRDLTVATVMGTSRWYLSGIVGHGTYAGIGAGFLYSRQAYQLGVIPQIERSAFHLAISPEVGVGIPIFDGVDAVVSAKYTVPAWAGDYLQGGSKSFQFLTIGLGLAEH